MGALGVDVSGTAAVLQPLQWYRIWCFLVFFIMLFILARMLIWRQSHMQLACEKPLPEGLGYVKYVPDRGLSISGGIGIVVGLVQCVH